MAGPPNPFTNLPPPGGKGGKKKKPETPAQRAAAAAAYQKAKGQNPYFQGQLFTSKWHDQIDPIWEAYTGSPATRAEAMQVIARGWSNYHLQVFLSGLKSFVNSPVWKTNAPAYNGIYQNIMGSNQKAPKKMIAYAIIHNLGSTGFEEQIRNSKQYVTSVEFKNNTAQMANVYQTIYGETPNADAMLAVKKATLAGWSSDQFARYLRNQPGYAYSNEAQNTINRLAAAFGGASAMTAQQANFQGEQYQGLPEDTRLAPPPAQAQPGQQPPPRY